VSCWEAPLEGCAPSQAQADRDDGIGSEPSTEELGDVRTTSTSVSQTSRFALCVI